MFHEFVEQNRKNIRSSWHQLKVRLTYMHLRALSDILSYSRMLEGCFPGIPGGDYHQRRASKKWGLKLLEVSLDQTAEGGTVRGITMQSLGSTPLLPLINTTLQMENPSGCIHCLFSEASHALSLFTLSCTFHGSTLLCLFASHEVLCAGHLEELRVLNTGACLV